MDSRLVQKASKFIGQTYREIGKTPDEAKKRLAEIEKEVLTTGTYIHTYEELSHGACMAWRNSNRCIGRLFWQTLAVFDERSADSAEEVFSALERHVKYAFNGGKIRPAITVFRQESKENKTIRIWNHQLLRYAGYQTEDGIVGDPDSLAFTQQCERLGWKGNGGRFDLLPWVVEAGEGNPEMQALPANAGLEVAIEHPDYDWFCDLGLKWYAVPIISDMKLEIGGIVYQTAPFNGWYMGTEIGARNLSDDTRYNQLPEIARRMELNTSKHSSLWKDRALVELNIAVLHSFKKARVSIVDHHTAAQQLKIFEQKEDEAGRSVTGEWTWLIPPVSPATTHIFHQNYNDQVQTPNFFYQKKPY